VLRVEHPGLLLAIQDGGRPGFAHLGVPPSGACDPWGLAAANVLAGAPADAAALEATLGGLVLSVEETCAVALAGADLGAERDDGRPLDAGVVHRLPAGSRIRLTGVARRADPGSVAGARAYLALAGGIAVGRVLGSASTLVQGRLGGIGGRALQAGDGLGPVRRGDLSAVGHRWPASSAPHPATRTGPIGFVPGPDLAQLPDEVMAALCAPAWTVSAASDRMGLRLSGTPLASGHEILSHPIVPGAIQVPADGRPLVLLVDGPTIGGYPVIGVVPRVDLPRLGQLRPGDRVRFGPLDASQARAALRDQQRAFARVADTLRADAPWHDLAGGAGG
jgi:biotin-dependent carboxylase-like uncharacterized protein